MNSTGFILATHEITDLATDAVIARTDLRIHYHFRSGAPEVRYQRDSDSGWPAEPDEIELIGVEREQTGQWLTVAPDHALSRWAATYLDQHHDAVVEAVRDTNADAQEYAAAMRAEDRWYNWAMDEP